MTTQSGPKVPDIAHMRYYLHSLKKQLIPQYMYIFISVNFEQDIYSWIAKYVSNCTPDCLLTVLTLKLKLSQYTIGHMISYDFGLLKFSHVKSPQAHYANMDLTFETKVPELLVIQATSSYTLSFSATYGHSLPGYPCVGLHCI